MLPLHRLRRPKRALARSRPAGRKSRRCPRPLRKSCTFKNSSRNGNSCHGLAGHIMRNVAPSSRSHRRYTSAIPGTHANGRPNVFRNNSRFCSTFVSLIVSSTVRNLPDTPSRPEQQRPSPPPPPLMHPQNPSTPHRLPDGHRHRIDNMPIRPRPPQHDLRPTNPHHHPRPPLIIRQKRPKPFRKQPQSLGRRTMPYPLRTAVPPRNAARRNRDNSVRR